jgi:hypothetical protein
MSLKHIFPTVIFAAFAFSAPVLASAPIVSNNITAAEVNAAQAAWGKALIQISQDYSQGGLAQATKTAKNVLDKAYGYQQGPVLFKPTLSSGEQTFRTSYDGALSYFVGGNPVYSQDQGFALKGWQQYSFNNAAVYINGDMALTMGKVMARFVLCYTIHLYHIAPIKSWLLTSESLKLQGAKCSEQNFIWPFLPWC